MDTCILDTVQCIIDTCIMESGPKCQQLEVGARRAPKLLVYYIWIKASLLYNFLVAGEWFLRKNTMGSERIKLLGKMVWNCACLFVGSWILYQWLHSATEYFAGLTGSAALRRRKHKRAWAVALWPLLALGSQLFSSGFVIRCPTHS